MKIKLTFLTLLALTQMGTAALDYSQGNVSRTSSGYTTGARSKAQISTPNGLARLGSDTQLGVDDKSLSLGKGVMLVASKPGGMNRKALSTEAMNSRVVTKGTALMAYYPKAYLKITCLEGTVRVSLNSLISEYVTLKPGQMLIINPTDDRLPEPVEIDLDRLLTTSQLVTGSWPEIANAGLWGKGVNGQIKDVEKGDLARSPLILKGASPEVTLVPRKPKNSGNPNPPPNNPPSGSGPGSGSAEEPCVPLYVIEDSNPSGTLTRGPNQPKADIVRIDGLVEDSLFVGTVLIADADLFCDTNSELQLRSGYIQVGESPISFASVGPSTTRLTTPAGVGIRFLPTTEVFFDNASVEAGTQSNPGPINIDTKGFVTITNSSLRGKSIHSQGGTSATTDLPPNLAITTSKLEALQGDIQLNQAGPITVTNSSQLLALAGNIALLSNGNQIYAGDSEFQAQGDLLIDGGGNNGFVTLHNMKMMADSIRVRGYNNDGDGLLIDGGQFTARLLKFYAEGGSTLRFRGDVRISAADAHLAGSTVTVDSGGSVNITGRGHVHADNHDYNTTGRGTINATGGLNQGTHSGKPGF